MSVEAILDRAKRNKLSELAGPSFRPPTTELIVELRNRNLDAVLGIQHDDGRYTVLGFDGLIVKNSLGEELIVPFSRAIPFLQKNAMAVGKGGSFAVVNFGEYGDIWMKDGRTMCAIWNIAIIMQKWDH